VFRWGSGRFGGGELEKRGEKGPGGEDGVWLAGWLADWKRRMKKMAMDENEREEEEAVINIRRRASGQRGGGSFSWGFIASS